MAGSLFGGLPVPSMDWNRSNGSAARSLLAGAEVGLQKRRQDFQEQKYEQELDQQKIAINGLLEKLSDNKVEDEVSAGSFIAKNPGVMINPRTAPLMKQLVSVFSTLSRIKTSAALAASKTIEGQTIAADIKRFAERRSKIDPETRSILDEMSPTDKGTPTSQMWSVLTTGEQKMQAMEAARKEERTLLSPTAMNQRANTEERIRIDNVKLAAGERKEAKELSPSEKTRLDNLKHERQKLMEAALVKDASDEVKQTIKNRLPQIDKQIAEFGKSEAKPAAASPAASAYKSAEEVRTAFTSGKIDREAAKKILEEQFNMK